MTMRLRRSLAWAATTVFSLVTLVLLVIAVVGWNWLRAPIERLVLDKTGRVLVINGDLTVAFGWSRPRLRAHAVTFANPPWTQEKQMLRADAVAFTLDLPQLLRRNIVFPEIWLERPVVYLEQGTQGRKNWLLDLNQHDESAQVRIDRLRLDHGTLGFDDPANRTSIRSNISTVRQQLGGSTDPGVVFNVRGQYKGLALVAQGSGGPVLALRDEQTPYKLKIDARVGHTAVQAEGTVTSLLKLSAVDMHLALHGDDLAQLYPLLGIAFPATRAYAAQGHLLHSGVAWRYEKFSGHVGDSDIAGSGQVNFGGGRASMSAELTSRLLDLDDLGPIIGARAGSLQTAQQAASVSADRATPRRARVLPDLPFKTDHWNSVDAEVSLRAKAIRRAKELPLENLVAHLSLRDSVLTLDPLKFGLAGGELDAVIELDGRRDPILAQARVQARNIALAKLFPTVALNQASTGQVNGHFDLSGQGNSVGRMLASANGKASLLVVGGEVSKLMMEKAGLHLWEILQLSLSGDRRVKLRCAVADFDLRSGNMQARTLILDTEITTIIGGGSIDLAQERLDLTLDQRTKATSPLALRSPIHVRGSFARPEVGVDKLRVAARAVGAVTLGIVNPFLAMIPLIDAGPGQDSDCAQLVRDVRAGKLVAR